MASTTAVRRKPWRDLMQAGELTADEITEAALAEQGHHDIPPLPPMRPPKRAKAAVLSAGQGMGSVSVNDIDTVWGSPASVNSIDALNQKKPPLEMKAEAAAAVLDAPDHLAEVVLTAVRSALRGRRPGLVLCFPDTDERE